MARLRRVLAGLGTTAIGATMALAPAGSAAADGTNPGWEADPNAIGNITFYNSSGVQVTGGSLDDSPLAAYAVAGSADPRSGDSHAQLYAFTPQVGVNPSQWSGEPLSGSIYSPVPSGTPSTVTASGLPFVTGASGDETLNQYFGDFPNNLTTAGYEDLYELRIYTTGTGQSADNTAYDRVDISVDTTADTWQAVYPSSIAPATHTTTALTVSPTTVTYGHNVTAKATVKSSSGSGTPVGTVEFKVNGQAAGSQPVNGSGVATLTAPAKAFPPGSYHVTATFEPTDSTKFTTSASSSKSVTIIGGPLKATKKPTLSGKDKVGAKETVKHGTWKPAASSYTYQWLLNGKSIKHATKSTYKLIKKDKGKKISCKVTAKRKNYQNGTATSKALKVKK